MDNKKLLIFGGAGLGVIILIVIIVTLLSGGSKKSGPSLSGDGRVTLNFWDPIDQPPIFKDIIDGFEAENPNISVNFVSKPLANYETESTRAITTGKGPDIWAIPNASILSNVDSLASAPSDLFKRGKDDRKDIKDYVDNRYPPIIDQENIIKDKNGDPKLYGLPLFIDTLALYSNPSLLHQRTHFFDRENIPYDHESFSHGPKTWNDMITMVKQYTQANNGTITSSAIALGRNDNVDNAPDILALLMMQDGATMASPDGLNATFNSPAPTKTGSNYYPGAQALDFFTSFADPNSPSYTWNQNFPTSYQAFRDGQTAMMVNYASVGNKLAQENPNLQFKVWPLPQINGSDKPIDFASYWTLTVPKSGLETDNPKACLQNPLPEPCAKTLASWQFIKYIATSASSTYTSNAHLPTPIIDNSPPSSVEYRSGSGSPFRFQPQTAKSWYQGKDPLKVAAEFNNMINSVVNLHTDPQVAVNQAASNVSVIFRERAGFNTDSSPTNQKIGQ